MGVCDSCGAEVDLGARFCGECGALVRAQPREIGADSVRGGPTKARSGQPQKNTKGKDAKGRGKAPDRDLRSTMKGISSPAPALPNAPTLPAVPPNPAPRVVAEQPPQIAVLTAPPPAAAPATSPQPTSPQPTSPQPTSPQPTSPPAASQAGDSKSAVPPAASPPAASPQRPAPQPAVSASQTGPQPMVLTAPPPTPSQPIAPANAASPSATPSATPNPATPTGPQRSALAGLAPPSDRPLAPMSVKGTAAPRRADVPTASSPPPPTTPSAPPSRPEEGRTEFQRLLDEVESGFDAILVTGDSVPPEGPKTITPPTERDESSPTSEDQFDHEQARQLFQDLVVANARSIRDFMIEVRLGEPHVAWIEHCEPAARAILRSAEGMGLTELVGKVRGYVTALEKARGEAGSVRGEGREKLIDAYSDLIAFFPEAFAAEAESNRREAVIVHALLSKVPGLFRLGIDRIYATGMASLGLFYVSRPREIAELGRISLEVAERITERFGEYRRTASSLSPAKGRAEERHKLRDAADEMRRASRAYDDDEPLSPERRVHRRERQLAMADVSIYLARFGEVDRLRRIEALPHEARVDALHAFLEEAERRAALEQRAR